MAAKGTPWILRSAQDDATGYVHGDAGKRTAGTKKKGPLERFAQGARESSGDLLSRIRGPGTIGDARLDFRVRDGNGYDPRSIAAETNSSHGKKLFLATAKVTKLRESGLPTRTD